MATQGYIGRAPGDSSVIVARQTFTPTGITTNFTFASGYTVGYVDAYLNGARLIEGSDYTATDGSVVGLTTHAQNGDVLEVVVYKAFNIGDVQAAKNDFSVGGNLSVTGVSTFTGAITATGGITGTVTGDATGLTGTPDIAIRNLTGVAATFTGVLSYDDVTNVDSLGVGTFRSGINVQGAGSTTTTLNVSGVTTMTGDANFGSVLNIDDSIVHSGDSNTKIRFPAADTFTVETGGSERLRINSDGLVKVGGNETVSAATGIQIQNAGAALLTLLRNDATISDGNTLGGIDFYGNDGGSVQQVAKISAVADGTHGDSDKPTALVFQTTNDGAGSATEKVRINSEGNVSIGGTEGITYSLLKGLVINTDNGDAGLIVNSSSSAHNAYISFGYGDSGAVTHADQFSAYIGRVGDDTLAFGTGNDIRARIDSSGRFLKGGSSSLQIGSSTPGFQLHDTASANGAMLSIARFNNDATGGKLVLGKSRNTSIAAGTVVQDDDTIGEIEFAADDGTDMVSRVVQIRAQVDGTPGGNDMPGRLVFMTTADGDATSTERLRIDRNGRILKTGTDARSNFFNSTWSPGIQSEDTDDKKTALSLVCAGNNANQGILLLGNTRNASVGGNTIVQDDDGTGIISFQGNDGSDMVETARIESKVDGTPGANDMPGRLIFRTTADGASSSTERLRIDSAGRLLKSGQASLTSTSLNHPIQVAASSDANAIAIIGRASDDIGELSYYEADKSTILGEIQYRRDHVNIRHRVGEIRFATAGVTDRMIINSGGDVNITGITTASQFDATSDVALKENIEVIDEPINKLSELKGVTFDWKAGGHSVGVIAQDVEKVLPTAVGGNKDQKTVNYNAIIGLLVESVKDQQKQIEELKSLLDK